jgi:nicotinamide-nucleotide adenylyltransferase
MKPSKIRKGIFIGRFQPYHKGHESVVKSALGKKGVDFLIIGIGSSRHNNTPENPFTFNERKKMIELSMPEKYRKKYSLIRIPDTNNDKKWTKLVERRAGKFEVVYTRNGWVSGLLRKSKAGDHLIIRPEMKFRINATMVRRLMIKNCDWESLVPNETARVIRKINGVERVWKIHNRIPRN